MSDKKMICQKCGEAEVLWLHTARGKAVLVDAEGVIDGEERYDKEKHSCHWETCPAKPEGQGQQQQDGRGTCKDCQQDVVWMLTKKGKKVPVVPSTYHDETIYNDWVNKCHWDVCPFRQSGEPADAPINNDQEIPF